MNNLLRLLIVIIMATAITLLSGIRKQAAAETGKETRFVDFDGDGFNDNIADEDSDGIPDSADPDFTKEPFKSDEPGSSQGGFINFTAGLKATGRLPDLATRTEKFGRRMFCTRALSQNRCGFTSEEGFGAESGIGIGATGGGACAGGVCR